MCDKPEVHVPKTRRGGVFTHPSEVSLHANDFSLEEKNNELTSKEKEWVEEYLKKWGDSLVNRARAVRPSSAAPQPWESHYSCSRHSFPLKNYIIHAFPVLKAYLDGSVARPSLLECGCGTGSTLLPLMKYSSAKDALFVAFDVSATSVKYFSEHEIAQEFTKRDRLYLFTYDAMDDTHAIHQDEHNLGVGDGAQRKRARSENTEDSLVSKMKSEFPVLADVTFDVVLLIFVLSALPTAEDMRIAIRQLRRAMKPGSVLLFRDYALPDHNFFRFLTKTEGEFRNGITFSKGDGTSQVFFNKEIAVQLFEECGFTTESVDYHCNRIVNRKNGKRMDKIFINGVFRAKKN